MRCWSAAGPTTWQPYFSFSAGTAAMWSMWWCVMTIQSMPKPLAESAASIGPASGGSTTAILPLPVSWST